MASNAQHEPTMEEILASIRKIISEDSTEEPAQGEQATEAVAEKPAEAAVSAPPQAEPAQAEPELAAEPEEADVLELTQEVQEEAAMPAAEPEPAPEPVAAVEAEKPVDDIVFETIEDEPEPAPAPAAASDNEIFSSKSRQALDDAFASLEPVEPAEPAPRDHAAPVAGLGGVSVEAVFDRAVRESFEPVLAQWLSDNRDQVIDRMKPVIREWLDEHFPALLEEAVQGEVARVVKARGRR